MESWFDAIITPAEQVEVSYNLAYVAWAVEQFCQYLQLIMPTQLIFIAPGE